MKSKTKIEKQLRRKTNNYVREVIIKAKKNEKWLEVASLLAMPRRLKIVKNLEQIDKESKEGDTIVVPGKVLSKGEISKKIRIAALSFSQEAERKLKAKKCEVIKLEEEIEKNAKMQAVKILK